MVLADWKKSKSYPSGVSWTRKRGTGFVYLYNKGWFRDKEKEYVISTSLTGGSNPQDRKNIGFKTKSQALRFVRKYMREN